MNVFVDTWAWIALAVRRDQYHSRATRQHREFVDAGRHYVTTDWVLSELITQLFRVSSADRASAFCGNVLSAFDSGQYQLERVSPQRFTAAWELRTSYADKPSISFVDFTSMVVMRDLGIQDVFTGDDEFKQVGLGFRLFPEA